MRLLDIYLRDHWAGAGAGTDLARRLAGNNSRAPWADALDEVATRIEEDDLTLQEVRDRLGVGGGGLKRAIARIGERISRLKPNGRLVGYSRLSPVLEAEALIAGVSAKRLLWSTLAAVSAEHPTLAGYDFAGLEQRADEQLAVLRRFHREATLDAFTSANRSTRS
ncbi:MAG TPA: hypothetical protein VJ948_09625 [Acidimicrobiia bacterium]|nr:hypothetical protein [Acidimicrobiia bacterium]